MPDGVYLKNRFFVSSILFGLLALAIVVLVAYPALREIRLINRQVYDERVRLEKLYLKGQLQKKVRETYDRIKDNTGFLDEALLKENEELPYITGLEQADEEVGVELKINVGERKRKPNEPLSTLGFNLDVKGNFTNVSRFLERLEQMPYYSNIQESTFAVREEKDNAQRLINATVSLDTFWLIPQ